MLTGRYNIPDLIPLTTSWCYSCQSAVQFFSYVSLVVFLTLYFYCLYAMFFGQSHPVRYFFKKNITHSKLNLYGVGIGRLKLISLLTILSTFPNVTPFVGGVFTLLHFLLFVVSLYFLSVDGLLSASVTTSACKLS